MNFWGKINAELQFLCRQNEFLTPKIRKLLCNSLIQQLFDYACISWYPLVSRKIIKKTKFTQSKCIHFCLKRNSRYHIGARERKEIN